MAILNLTQHRASPEQINAGVLDLQDESFLKLKSLLNFTKIPTVDELNSRAQSIAEIALMHEIKEVMIGGAPFFMGILEDALVINGIRPAYAFSVRGSKEAVINGKTEKVSYFKHKGFVRVI